MPPPTLGALLAALGLAWLAGVALQLQQAGLWPIEVYVGGVVAAAVACAVACAVAGAVPRATAARGRGRHIVALLCVPAAALAGFGLTGLNASLRLADGLLQAIEGRDLLVTGIVADMPQAGATGLRFRFEIETASLDGGEVRAPRRVSLSWYAPRDANDDAPAPPLADLRAGQRWQMLVRLKAPHGNANPHGFDYELYLFEQGVRATGYVRNGVAPRQLGPAAGCWIARWRQAVRDRLTSAVSDPNAAGVLAALAVGDQAAIEREDWAVFRNTGVAHLMSISGLHITMFAWLAAVLVAPLWRRSTRARSSSMSGSRLWLRSAATRRSQIFRVVSASARFCSAISTSRWR